MQQAETILRFPEAAASRGLSRSTCYQQIARGLMPRPVRIGARAIGWPAKEIAAINAARIAGKSDDEIRQLVMRLEAKRFRMRKSSPYERDEQNRVPPSGRG